MGCCSSQLVDNEPSRALDNIPASGNKQLRNKSISWTSDSPITLVQLQAKRDAFWEATSTYEGRKEVWDQLRAACETTDLSQAQTIVNSLKLTVPTGHLSDGCTDEQGNRYVVPLYCFVEPTNLLRTSDEHLRNLALAPDLEMSDKKVGNNVTFEPQIPIITITEHVDSESDPAEPQPEPQPQVTYEPTAEPVYTPPASTDSALDQEELIIRLNTGQDAHVKVNLDDTMRTVKNKLCAIENVDPASVNIRFIYMGKILEDSASVRDTKIPSRGVIQALVVRV
ncbi:hypothetical protein K493DRAFT_310675 [Basidiobolus meristosporus CBS 931.73]|uniref:Ubiquitin-like domain-containing protein n=1 Tax=Basidiobolus meristosporus CBS 931.73 TaxID=1314790 RepID=A0A1Y1Z7E9_9FUNG|nr:hypothetical protein K493DRAFT_310675 [Basidiobolus meristosporus CBS 931.73]|eukprot:ORY06173.1 hypothetical protein K493DRAFT_310675 [Basidiobolus meristosporus CBS 931.73]